MIKNIKGTPMSRGDGDVYGCHPVALSSSYGVPWWLILPCYTFDPTTIPTPFLFSAKSRLCALFEYLPESSLIPKGR